VRYPDPFRSVRDLGLVSPGCPGGSGSSQGYSSAWLPAARPRARPMVFKSVRGSQVTSAATCALASGHDAPTKTIPCISRTSLLGRLAVTVPRAWPPHNCWHSSLRGAYRGPAGQFGSTPGCGWGFEADLIPAHSPMMSRTTMIHPTPIHRFTGFLGGPGDRFGRRCASR
jgi:hypothetical protein